MNALDLIIIGAVGIVALLGLKSGILKPISGIGGFVLGVFLALQNYGEVALLLSEYIEGAMFKNIAAFVSIHK